MGAIFAVDSLLTTCRTIVLLGLFALQIGVLDRKLVVFIREKFVNFNPRILLDNTR